MRVKGIHHVSSLSSNIAGNLEFCTSVLGMRMVKKTVNQDDVGAYHLYYADAEGSPGTAYTFFDYPGMARRVLGAGCVSLTGLRVKGDSLDWWQERLAKWMPEREDHRLTFEDPEGHRNALIADDGLPEIAQPWDATVPAEHTLRGFHSVEINSANGGQTIKVLTDLLGFEEKADGLLEVRGDDHFSQVVVRHTRDGFYRPGAGGVHHVAFRAEDDDHLYAIKDAVEAAGLQTSGFVDRFYFHSLYFREPGGVLFEIATDGPGFDTDEPKETMGQTVALPPFLEPRRQAIESGLMPLPQPEYVQ